MATGDLIEFGTLLVNGNKQLFPTRPWRTDMTPPGAPGVGNIPHYSAGATVTFANSDANSAYRIKCREVNINGKKLYIPISNLLVNISHQDLNLMGFVNGKEYVIDGKKVLARLLTGGTETRNRDYYAGGIPENNEWDQIIVNEAGLTGLPKPSVTDLDKSTDAKDLNSPHNQYWNWMYVYSWVKEKYSHKGDRYNDLYSVYRGYFSARHFGFSISKNTISDRHPNCGFRPVFEVVTEVPTLVVETTNNQTLYEGDSLILNGFVKDNNMGDVVTVYYRAGTDGAQRPIKTEISNGSNTITFEKVLTFSESKLMDGPMTLFNNMMQGVPYTLQVWAADDKGGKSPTNTITFYVVPNRPPVLSIKPIGEQSNLIKSDTLSITGNANDPDNNNITVGYRLNNSKLTQIHQGASADFSLEIPVGDLNDGENTVVVEVADSYGSKTSKSIYFKRQSNTVPINQSVQRYVVAHNAGPVQRLSFWVRRHPSLNIKVEISMTNEGEPENFKPVELDSSGPIADSLVEDFFKFDNGSPAENVVLKVTLDGDGAISRIQGVVVE